MLDLAKEFSLLGFLEEAEEDGTVTYVMDFPDDVYITVTDENGRKHTAFTSDSDKIMLFMDYAAVICKIRNADLFSLLIDFDELT